MVQRPIMEFPHLGAEHGGINKVRFNGGVWGTRSTRVNRGKGPTSHEDFHVYFEDRLERGGLLLGPHKWGPNLVIAGVNPVRYFLGRPGKFLVLLV